LKHITRCFYREAQESAPESNRIRDQGSARIWNRQRIAQQRDGASSLWFTPPYWKQAHFFSCEASRLFQCL